MRTEQPSPTPRDELRDRLRDLGDRPHSSWPRWTYRDFINAQHALRLADSATGPLDVERLAAALNATVGKYGWARSTPASPVEEWLVNAKRVATEYARLASQSSGDH